MHKSRLAGFIIDCHGTDLDGATRFWSAALGLGAAGREGDRYDRLDASARDLDIEADDLEAEVARLEALGARRVGFVERWWVMEAPTGQRFCVVQHHGWEG